MLLVTILSVIGVEHWNTVIRIMLCSQDVAYFFRGLEHTASIIYVGHLGTESNTSRKITKVWLSVGVSVTSDTSPTSLVGVCDLRYQSGGSV